jgi:transcriptional regulator with XRE-family HTH domain
MFRPPLVVPHESPPGPLRLARLTRGWRQADLASRAGCSRRYVSKIEAGYLPAPHVQEALAAALELDALELFPDGATGNGARATQEPPANERARASGAPSGGTP